MVLKNCRRRMTNLAVCWIDYKKAYDLLPHSWIKQCMEWFGFAGNVRRTLEKSMSSWRSELTSGRETLGEVKIKRGIFQGDSLSSLLFVLTQTPMTMVLNTTRSGCQLGKNRGCINHLLFMDDLKLFAKNVEELDSLVQTVRVASEDIGIELGTQKYAMVVMKRGRLVKSEGIELLNGETIKGLEESEGYKYLGILECEKLESDENERNT